MLMFIPKKFKCLVGYNYSFIIDCKTVVFFLRTRATVSDGASIFERTKTSKNDCFAVYLYRLYKGSLLRHFVTFSSKIRILSTSSGALVVGL